MEVLYLHQVKHPAFLMLLLVFWIFEPELLLIYPFRSCISPSFPGAKRLLSDQNLSEVQDWVVISNPQDRQKGHPK